MCVAAVGRGMSGVGRRCVAKRAAGTQHASGSTPAHNTHLRLVDSGGKPGAAAGVGRVSRCVCVWQWLESGRGGESHQRCVRRESTWVLRAWMHCAGEVWCECDAVILNNGSFSSSHHGGFGCVIWLHEIPLRLPYHLPAPPQHHSVRSQSLSFIVDSPRSSRPATTVGL